MAEKRISIGARSSELAKKQAEMFVNETGLKAHIIKAITTKGDIDKRPLHEIGEGIFTKEIDKALLNGEIDLAVHSLKDIPVEGFHKDLEIAFVFGRQDARDCMVGRLGVVGTDSIRRQYEMKSISNNVTFKPLRGNIGTRISKIESKEYDGIIAAKCALDRLGLSNKISRIFSIDDMVPAAGQGAIAVVKRKKDKFSFLKKNKLYYCCMLERGFIRGLGGCKKPVGAFCESRNNKFYLTGVLYSGQKRIFKKFNGKREEIARAIKEWKKHWIRK